MTRVLLLIAALLTVGCTAGGKQYTSCKIESNPSSAEVWVGSEKKEQESTQRDSTPCDLLFSAPGEYEVHLKKAGYETVMRRVTVIEEETTEGTILKALPPSMTVTLDPVEGSGGAGKTDGKDGKTGKGDKPYYE